MTFSLYLTAVTIPAFKQKNFFVSCVTIVTFDFCAIKILVLTYLLS